MEILILAGLILCNGAFAMSEVAVLTSRRTRLAAQAAGGDRLAAAALQLVEAPTRFLSTVQIGITSIGILNGIIGEAVLAAPVALWLQSLGVEPRASGIVATAVVVIAVTYFSIVIGELVPKRLGQHNPEAIAKLIAWPMRLLARISAPFVGLLALSTEAILRPLLALFRMQRAPAGGTPLSPQEIRAIVLESSGLMPPKHTSILLNLFDLGEVTVLDLMVPRAKIEAIRLDDDIGTLRRQLATSYHREIVVYRDGGGEVAGILHLRKVLGALLAGTLERATIEALLDEPYYVPATTPAIAQLQYFQEKRERVALLVDEYGELKGLITLEDIIEEMIGKFTTSLPSAAPALAWNEDGSASADGSTPVREVNRALGLNLPTDGPKTLNGLILEHLREIPEADVAIKIAGVPIEIVHAQGRVVKSARLFKPAEPHPESTL
jgi:Mg2+/Co2+ transporter CorB